MNLSKLAADCTHQGYYLDMELKNQQKWTFSDGVVNYHNVTKGNGGAVVYGILETYTIEGQQQRSSTMPYLVKAKLDEGSQLFTTFYLLKTFLEVQLGTSIKCEYGGIVYLSVGAQVYNTICQLVQGNDHPKLAVQIGVSHVVWTNNTPRIKCFINAVELAEESTPVKEDMPQPNPPQKRKKPALKRQNAVRRRIDYEEEVAPEIQQPSDLGDANACFQSIRDPETGEQSGLSDSFL